MEGTVRHVLWLVAAAGLCAGLLGPPADTASAQASSVAVDFSFCPPKSCYYPGENFSVLFVIVNVVSSDDFVYDDLAYMVKVLNVSAHFSWMAPNEHVWNDVSHNSSWLEPDGVGSAAYSLPLEVPSDLAPQVCSYSLKVDYMLHTVWGNITDTWGVGTTYRDFVVSAEPGDDGLSETDYLPYVSFAAILIALGAIGGILYHRHDRGVVRAGGAGFAGAGGTAANDVGTGIYPIVRPSPGERVEVDRGFVYFVKETRPAVALSMYDGAVARGAKGLVLTREHPNRLRLVHEFSAEKTAWLTRKAGKDQVDPTELSLVSLMITRFIEGHEKTVVFVEGLEYLITQNDFESVLRFVNHLHDFVLAYDSALIVVVDPRVLSTREMALLERSAKVIEPVAPPVEKPEENAEAGHAK